MEERIFIGVGTNTGNRYNNLKIAVRKLAQQAEICQLSSVYETEPWGYTDQPQFLNQVIEIKTPLEPAALLAALKQIESDLGRTPTFRYGPRLIDLDILLYGQRQLIQDTLTIPHPRYTERAFVLLPLVEIAPDLIDPASGVSVQEFAGRIDPAGVTQIFDRSKVELSMRPGLEGFKWGEKTYLMGIVNVTPDSFSGDGVLKGADSHQKMIEQVHGFISDGAEIVDIGGESTRPGAESISLEAECARVIPAIRAVRELDPAVIISVDTYKADVAQAALEAGADWINDVWGLRADPHMAETAAKAKVPVILMHNRSKPANAQLQSRLGGRYVGVAYDDLIGDISRELFESVKLAQTAGIADSHIILDPGVGFGKTVEQNLELIDRLDEIRKLGYPLLLGASRKSFIGYTLNLPPDQRLEGTAAAAAIGIDRGADILRVHDIKEIARVARMTDAIVRRKCIR